jgi:IS5 family transposase
VDSNNVARRSVASDLSAILASPEVVRLIGELQETRQTGRPGYPLRSMVGMALAKSMYAIPTWTRTVALVREHPALAVVIAPDGDVPSVYACYRFTAKLRAHTDMLEECIAGVLKELKKRNPLLGWDVAIDASDMPAYANGQRYKYKGGPEREKYSDPDATWGHRSAISTRKGGGFYGYKLHLAVCAQTDLPLAWKVEAARVSESTTVEPLLDKLKGLGFSPETCAMDKGYDSGPVYEACENRGIRPIICLKETARVKRGDHKSPTCEHGEWRFGGFDAKRGATQWRCPTGECAPKSKWIKIDRLHPAIPRETLRWKGLYRGRASVEREFGRLKHEWALAPLRVRGIERVRLHADLTILTKLSCELAKARNSQSQKSKRAV